MNKKIHRTIAVLAAACIATAGCAEQTKPEPPDQLPDPEPLVINTVERQDDIVLTVMRGQEEVFQYEGDIEMRKASDGKAYGIIYLDDEEVLQ